MEEMQHSRVQLSPDVLIWTIQEYNGLPEVNQCCSRTRGLRRILDAYSKQDFLRRGEAESISELIESQSELGCQAEGSNKCSCEPRLRTYENTIGFLWDHPQERLASYGTLRPGYCNHHHVSSIQGAWIDGTIYGEVFERNNYPVFIWKLDGAAVPVQVLVSRDLPDSISKVDDFEGEGYRRIIVPVSMNGQVLACCVYADSHQQNSAAATHFWSR